MNDLPNKWSLVKLGEICEVKGGFAFKTSSYKNSGIPLVRISNIKNNKVNLEDCVYLDSSFRETAKNFLLKNGDILIALSGATTGKYGIYNLDETALLNQRIGRLHFENLDTIDPKFVYLYLATLKDKILKEAYGAAQPNISPKEISDFEIPLPPLPEQKKIVAKIEELFSELDSGVANLRKAKEQIKTYRQSVLAHAFTGRLHQDSQDLQIDRIKESSKSSNLENPGSDILPDNWKWVKLGEVISDFKRGPFGSTIKKSFFIDKGFKVYEQKNAIYKDHNLGDYYISEDKYNELEGFAVKGGDYLVSCSGTIGRIYKLPSTTPRGIINQALLRMRINDRQINENFFVYLFESELFQRKIIVESRGSAMKNLAGVKELKQIEFVLPPLPQQSYIVEEIEKRFSVADNLEKAIDESLNRSNKLRQSILKKAFEGNLV